MYTYLALGDSYTIGEQVPLQESFPYQTAGKLKEHQIEVAQPFIIATTGWITDELAAGIREHNIPENFSFVTLLIGVNNQYRGLELEHYRQGFSQLLDMAVMFANGHTQNVFVLSIPDWGVTPFAEGKDRAQIAREIDAFNQANREITEAGKCQYLDITDSTRQNGGNPEFLAADKLHPSGKEYAIWAKDWRR